MQYCSVKCQGDALFGVELDAYYQAIFQYKKHKSYLPGCPDNYKRVLRKSAVSYTVFEDKLFYTTDGELRYVPMTWKERLYYLASAHMSQKGKHINKNNMAQWMTDKKIAWKGISVDCTAFAAACPHCTLGERKSEPISKQSFKDDPVLKMAEDNYSLLLNYLQKQTFPSTTPQSQKDTVTSIAKNFVIQKGVLYHKKGKMGDLRCLEVGTKDRKVAMQAAHVSNDEHFGPGDTFSRLSDKFVWNRMGESVNNFIAGCCKKKDEEYATPRTLINRNVDFFNKQFLNGVVDKILVQGKEKYSKPVIQDLLDHIKEEPNSPVKEEEAVEMGEKNEENEKQEGNTSGEKSEVKETQEGNENQKVKETQEGNENQKVKETQEGNENQKVKETQEGNENQKCQEKTDKAGETEEKTEETEKQKKSTTQNQTLRKEQSPTNRKITSTKSFTRGPEKETEAHGLDTMITTTVGNVMKTGVMSDRVTRTAVSSIIPPEELEEEEEEEEEAMQTETLTEVVPKIEDVSGSSSTGVKEEEKKGKAIHLVCEYCGMIFKGHNKYKIHMYGHTGVKPYPCTLCDKSFTLKKTLKFHLGKHAGQKPFLCNICGKRFHVPNSLRSHLQIHAKGGNNIHYCKLCNREFATDARFEKHLKFKHPPEEEEHLCSQCGKKFCSRKSLKRHEKSAHDAVKSHFCKVCERGFFRKEYLNRHMQQHELQTEGGTKKVKSLVIRKPKALQNKKPTTKTVEKTEPGNIIIQTVQEGENPSISNVVGNIRIEVEPGQVEEYFIQEGDGSTENMYYAVETNEVDQEGGGSTLVYSFPSVQYEIECPDGQLNQEALSAITMLAQASSQQNV
uniref:C2H2-type domain-containing protein n=1 Tax=Magallana gigas TaxID=29159 RepID=A0A8W8JMF0_MAGGI